MPWEVKARPQKWDEKIRAQFRSVSGLLPVHADKPAGAGEKVVVQAIALPTLIALIGNQAEPIREAARWESLTLEEKKLIVQHYGLRDQYRVVMHFFHDSTQIMRMASYMGACFEYTTLLTSMVIDLGDLVSAAVAWERQQPSLIDKFRSTGMLMIKGVFGKHPDLKRVDGVIYKLLASRADHYKPTVLLDCMPTLALNSRLMRGQLPTFEELEKILDKDENGATRLGYFIGGTNTYINFNSNAREFNDSRFGLSV